MRESLKKLRIEYHKQELEQLTGVEWVQKVPSAGDDTKWGPQGTPADKNPMEPSMNHTFTCDECVQLFKGAPSICIAGFKLCPKCYHEHNKKEQRKAAGLFAMEQKEPTVDFGPGFIAVIAKESVDELKKDIEGLNVTLDSLYGRIVAIEQRLYGLEELARTTDEYGDHWEPATTKNPVVPTSGVGDDDAD